MSATTTSCPRQTLEEEGVPTRSRVAGLFALLACVACCALPYLIVAGILTGAGAALLQQTLIVVAVGLGVLALALWWLRRRQLARRAAENGDTGCSTAGCGC